MKIAVIGGTGFTGKRVLSCLKGQKDVRCIIRNPENISLIQKFGFEYYIADVKDRESLKKGLKGFDGLINIMSLGFGDADNIVGAAVDAGIKRAVFVSTTAIETKLNASSKKVRLEGEKRIKESSLSWTILRPTMIYGGADDRNIIKFIKFVKKVPIILVPGKGDSLQQPVHVEDVAHAVVTSFFEEKTKFKTYNVSGKTPLTFNEMIKVTAKALNVKRRIIHIPWKPIALFLRLLEKIMRKPFLKEEQILRLLEDKSFSHEEAKNDFNYNPRDFKTGVTSEIDFYLKKTFSNV